MNTFTYKNYSYKNDGFYDVNLHFNEHTMSNIVKEAYDMENISGNIYSSYSRTFKLKNGFHSCNLLDKSILHEDKTILERYTNISILISRIQELLYNYFSVANNIDFTNSPNYLKITEIWFNILRKGDFNLAHIHAENYISGNFYILCPKVTFPEGCLEFLSMDNHSFFLPQSIKNEGRSKMISPSPGLGIIFQSHHKHIVYPHFSDSDRIGFAFNAQIDYSHHYDKIYPTPYWLPIQYTFIFNKDKHVKDNKLHITFKNNLSITISEDNIDTIIESHNGDKISLNKKSLQKVLHHRSIDFTKYFICDDYFKVSNKPWKQDDHYYYEKNNSDTLLIVFSGMGGDQNPPTFIFYNFLKQYTCDKLFLRDLQKTWFLQNSNFGSNVLETASYIKNLFTKKYKKICILGCSSGGFAALLYSRLLKSDHCLVFSPQTLLTEKKKYTFKDERWEALLHELRKTINPKYLDLQLFTPFHVTTKIIVSDPLDLQHAKYIEHDKCEIEYIDIKQPNFNKHLTALYLKQTNKLKDIIDTYFKL